MSFIKKAIKKVTSFVKKYWVQIAMIALIVFTAGVMSPLGFAAFSAPGGTFLGAVGQTMAAGVAQIGASVGIGSGVAAPSAASAATIEGAALAGEIGVTGTGIGTGSAGASFTMPGAASSTALAAPAGSSVAAAAAPAGSLTVVPTASKGLSAKGILDGASKIAQIGGTVMTAMSNDYEDQAPLASWGVDVGEDEQYYNDIIAGGEPGAPAPLMGQSGAGSFAPVGAEALTPAGQPNTQGAAQLTAAGMPADRPRPLMQQPPEEKQYA